MTDGPEIPPTTTGSDGIYSFQVDAGEEYTIKFEDPSGKYKVDKIDASKFELLEKNNLEIAYIYNPDELIDKDVGKLENKMVKDDKTQAFIQKELKFEKIDDNDDIDHIGLLRNTHNDDAFHYAGIRGWISIGIIFHNDKQKIKDDYLEYYYAGRNHYQWIIVDPNTPIWKIMDDNKNKFGLKDMIPLEEKENQAEYDLEEVNSVTVVDCTLAEGSSPGGGSTPSTHTNETGFFTIEIESDDYSGSENASVSLEYIDTDDKTQIIGEDPCSIPGSVGFGYKKAGTYIITCEFKGTGENGLNGEYYDIESVELTSESENSIRLQCRK